MTIDDFVKKVQDRLGAKVLKVYRHSPRRVYLDIYPKDIVEVTRLVFKEMGLRFNIASAVDTFDGFEVLYHFTLDNAGFVATFRVLLKDRENPRIDTITKVTRSAWWIEREIHELFGIVFDGNEDLRPLLLPEEWPKGVYPMRKDFVPPKRDSRKA